MSRNDYAKDFALRIKALGFRVWLAERGHYGFFSDDAGARVVSFQFDNVGRLSGNYGPPSSESGTGWQMDEDPSDLRTADDVRRALNAYPPAFAGKGWRKLTTVAEYLTDYASSRFFEVIA